MIPKGVTAVAQCRSSCLRQNLVWCCRMEEAQISDPLVWKEVESERVLVGKVLARKSYLRSTIEAILRKAWNLQEGFDVIEVTGNAFMFRFSEEEDYCRILRGRLWSINSCVLNLVERSRYSSCEEFDFAAMLVRSSWPRIRSTKAISSQLPRARVVVDLRKSLANGFWLPRPDGRKSVAARKDGRLLRDIAPEMLANKVLLELTSSVQKPKFRTSSNGCHTGTCSTMEDFDEGVLDLGAGQDLKSEGRNNDGLSDSVAIGVDPLNHGMRITGRSPI
ncbi:hypothetical protein K1719_043316 [Acacia pycnantha]|nr:hypothetical protein K1719_043316 [Acacia pycnantha]